MEGEGEGSGGCVTTQVIHIVLECIVSMEYLSIPERCVDEVIMLSSDTYTVHSKHQTGIFLLRTEVLFILCVALLFTPYKSDAQGALTTRWIKTEPCCHF